MDLESRNRIGKDPARSAPSWFHACLTFSGKDAGFGARDALDPDLTSCVNFFLSEPHGPIYEREEHNAYFIKPYSKRIL